MKYNFFLKTINKLIDSTFQQAYRIAYFFLKLSWRFIKRETHGAQVMLWVNGKILLVRSSYRKEYSFPGGYINANETAVQAASRELAEEVKINVAESTLTLRNKIEYLEYGRHAIDYIFNCEMNKYPAIIINNREIIDAIFISPSAALELPLCISVRDSIYNGY